MNIFELAAKISLDTKDYEQGVDKAKKLISSVREGISTVAEKTVEMGKVVNNTGETAVKTFVGISTAVGTAAGALIKFSTDAYGNFEQLEGGVETLFKDSADAVIKYADNAYKTAGLSGNKYIEMVTSFSASLLQSLAGDTEKAANYGDMAITDMSDNANKLGTDISMIQNAYQGFAKQNYTMLDNLKLGYGGTKAEMERLIQDAARLSDTVDAQSLSFSNIVEAIHVVQTEMGITGTTALEAEKTIQGSAASMKASWENFLTALATGSDEADEKLERLLSSIKIYAGNLMPAVKRTIGSVYNIIEKNSDKAISFVVGLFGNAAKKAPEMIKNGTALIKKVVDGISQNKDSLKTNAIDIFNALADGFEESLDVLLPLAEDLVPTVAQILLRYKDVVFNAGLDIVLALIRGIASDPEGLKDTASSIIGSLVDKLSSEETLSTLIGGGAKILGALAGAIVDNIGDSESGILGVPSKIIDAIVTEIKKPEALNGLADGAVSILFGLTDFIVDNLSNLGKAAIDIIEGLTLRLSEDKNLEKLKEGAASIIIAISDFFANLDADQARRISDAGFEIVKAIAAGIFSEESLRALGGAFVNLFKQLPQIIGNALSNSGVGLLLRLVFESDQGPSSSVSDAIGAIKGSHRNGLPYVPHDGYIAELHEGERVLTRSEARDYKSGGGGVSINVTVNGAKYSDEESLAEAVAEKIQDMIERERENND